MDKGEQGFDLETLKRAVAGDQEAVADLILRNDKLIWSIARKFINSGVDLDDLYTIAKIGLLKSFPAFNFDKGVKFISFSSRVAGNEILMYLRKTKRWGDNESRHMEDTIGTDPEGRELTILDTLKDNSPDALSILESKEDIYRITKALPKLQERDKKVLELIYMRGLNQREVAEEMGITQSYISRIEKVALERLKKLFEKEEGELVVAKSQINNDRTINKLVYIFDTFPEFNKSFVADRVGVVKSTVFYHYGKYQQGVYDDLEREKVFISEEDLDKHMYSKKYKPEKKEPKIETTIDEGVSVAPSVYPQETAKAFYPIVTTQSQVANITFSLTGVTAHQLSSVLMNSLGLLNGEDIYNLDISISK